MQERPGSVRLWPRLLAAGLVACLAAGAARAAPPRDPASAVASLDVAAGLAATLFAAEPDIANVTCLDVDHRGRVWIGDVRNYRRRNGSRPAGDRILVLEDADRDGIAEQVTVFHQGRDIDSVHGICVLGSRVIVSAGDSVRVFHDDDGDLVADRQEPLFTGIGGTQHDHGIHAVVFGPDGRLYFNFGNEGHRLRDRAGRPVIDRAGNEVSDARRPYQQGMVFRCRPDGSELETLGWNFRNNWKLAVDSFGTIWQSDNDDDGNQGVRINYVMEFGNYGYRDELTGAGWNQQRTNMEQDVPRRHWHLDDPGVVPTLLLTGAGSPTGICVYEGTLLPARFRGQPIHCDAGPSVCRAYVTQPAGAGWSAEIVDILRGTRDNWFRPSDVAVAPDGALFVADWYDPGVGGHAQGEVEKGRVFRVAPPGVRPVVPEPDFTTPAGAAAALESPNSATRALAWTTLERFGDAARPAVEPLWNRTGDDRLRARALWFLGGRPGSDPAFVDRALRDPSADIRVVALRAARAAGRDPIPLVQALVADESPAVRRECAIALRHSRAPEAPALWARLALAHDGRDRWYLEALGIGADGNWDACLEAYVAAAGAALLGDAGKDVIWRSRARRTPELLVRVLGDAATPAAARPRFMRAFDFLPDGPEKNAALESLLTLE